MESEGFRRLALELPEVEDKSHFGRADFRLRNKIFAALPNAQHGVVKLLPEQRDMLLASEPKIFSAIKGGWGDQGWTRVELSLVDALTAQSALRMAWRNVAPKKMLPLLD